MPSVVFELEQYAVSDGGADDVAHGGRGRILADWSESALGVVGSEGPRAAAGKELAAKLGISASRLVRLFKAELGISLVDYLNRIRIDRFRVLVEACEQNLLSVARAAGFGSYAPFHRVFRKAHGAAPRDFVRAR